MNLSRFEGLWKDLSAGLLEMGTTEIMNRADEHPGRRNFGPSSVSPANKQEQRK